MRHGEGIVNADNQDSDDVAKRKNTKKGEKKRRKSLQSKRKKWLRRNRDEGGQRGGNE